MSPAIGKQDVRGGSLRVDQIAALGLALTMTGLAGCSDSSAPTGAQQPAPSEQRAGKGGAEDGRPSERPSEVDVPTEAQRARLPGPSSEMGPDDVVKIQIGAMRSNDDPFPNAGIATAFKFASPSNRKQTGPLGRFIRMVKGPAYRPMLEYDRAEFGPLEKKGETRARQMVALYREGEAEPAVYGFMLSRQQAGGKEGTWMTDGVMRLDPAMWERQKGEGVAATVTAPPTATASGR